MKIPKIISGLMLVAVILGATWLVFSRSDQQEQDDMTAFLEKPSAESVQEDALVADLSVESQLTEQIESVAELIIDNGSDMPQSFNLEVSEQATAFSLLQDTGLDIEFQQYDFGVFVEDIGGIKNGEDDKYWLFYVNGEMPMVSADNQTIVSGDKIEFKFELSQF